MLSARKYTKRGLLLFVTALSVFLGGETDALEDGRLRAALAQLPSWRNSVLLIRVFCPAEERPYLGTGVVIDPSGLVLSAAHVGNACPAITDVRMGAVRSPYAGPESEFTAVRIRRRVDGVEEEPNAAVTGRGWYEDLALYRISNMAGSGLVPARISQAYPVPGEDVTVVGFSGIPYWYSNGPAAAPGLTIFKTALVSVAARADNVPYRLHYTGATLPGTSGGPVFNQAGELVGIHSGRVTQGKTGVGLVDNYSWATSVLALPAAWELPR